MLKQANSIPGARRLSNPRQNERSDILALLIAARGEWVPLGNISACAVFWAARIHELRRLGFRILNEARRDVEGKQRAWFRLETGPTVVQKAEATDTPSFPELGCLEPARRYPD